LADGMTQLIKVSVRRERPLRDDGTRASGFAFPSGHSAGSLCAATVLPSSPADVMTQLIKVSVRRERPLRDDGTRASGFAFPSGHSAGTFAAATVLQQHLGWKWAVPTYTIASYVAMSRLVDDRHWASDVTAGAALGIIVGRSVTW